MWGLVAVVGLPAASGQTLLDVNAATLDELDALPGVGRAKAQALLVWRAESGPCRSLDDLAEVPGFGPGTLATLRSRARCGDGRPDVDASDDSPDAVRALDASVLHTSPVDINSAGPHALTELPGISLGRAHDIVAYRKANGPFASCADLAKLPGIGAATVELLTERCTTSSPR